MEKKNQTRDFWFRQPGWKNSRSTRQSMSVSCTLAVSVQPQGPKEGMYVSGLRRKICGAWPRTGCLPLGWDSGKPLMAELEMCEPPDVPPKAVFPCNLSLQPGSCASLEWLQLPKSGNFSDRLKLQTWHAFKRLPWSLVKDPSPLSVCLRKAEGC